MIIVELAEGQETLSEIERICQHLCEHKELSNLMTDKQREDLGYILKPTTAADYEEYDKRLHWESLLQNFVVYNASGKEFRFHRDEQNQRLYFGDKEGFETIQMLAENEKPITSSHQRF